LCKTSCFCTLFPFIFAGTRAKRQKRSEHNTYLDTLERGEQATAHFHSPVEHSVEKQENADFAFDKQKGFNGLHYRSHGRWNL